MIVETLSIFFLLSLGGAYVLFKLLKSSAVIKTHKYRAGGAVAGFLIIYGMLFGSYYKIARQGPTISGTVGPGLHDVKVVLAVAEEQPDSDGHFKLATPFNLNLKKSNARLYLLTPPGKIFTDTGNSVFLYSLPDNTAEMKNIDFPSRLKESDGQ
ncbi:MAG: hypothetical protein P8Z30_18295 [Acidobacteriota bacterium]